MRVAVPPVVSPGAAPIAGGSLTHAGPQYPGTTMCSAFRTFQGWAALSDMDHDQGVLHIVPIPEALAYLMLRPLLADVAEDDMCGVTVNQVLPASQTWHPLLMWALVGSPDVRAGDSVWWRCDMIHSVAPVENQQGWGSVMYIPAAPWCPRNEQVGTAAGSGRRSGGVAGACRGHRAGDRVR
ncbi:YbiU family protein [Micromonospora sp. NPDC050200]|uniref:YbiU family protein n=1 Tax=Micromonospora sp. NPDC050200 TaxID=3155664 RepID=UPI003403B4C0